jgi:hypothetical protein
MKTLSIEEKVALYIKAWNTKGSEEIKAVIKQCWTDKTTYVDHLTPMLSGGDAITALIESSEAKVPGRKFDLLKLEVHNQTGLSKWLLTRIDGSTVEGQDFMEFDGENFITRVVGFF